MTRRHYGRNRHVSSRYCNLPGFAAAGVFLAGAALCGLAWYNRYWLWRDCFNELGRCYDPDSQQVFLEQAGVAWGTLTGVCLLVAVVLARRALLK